MSDETIRMSDLFDRLPVGEGVILQLGFYTDEVSKSMEGFIDQKFRHSVYSYSVSFISSDKRSIGYYWIKPKYERPKCLRIIGFENV